MPFAHGVPSHDQLGNVFARLDVQQFSSPGWSGLRQRCARCWRKGKVLHQLATRRRQADRSRSAPATGVSPENGLHLVMDMVFRDDECRMRSAHAPAHFATIKHMASKSPAPRQGETQHARQRARRPASPAVGVLAVPVRHRRVCSLPATPFLRALPVRVRPATIRRWTFRVRSSLFAFGKRSIAQSAAC